MFDAVKVALLLGALLILAWSAIPGSAEAASVTCEGAGHTCHAIDANGKTHHYKLIEAY
jgi:hypothetical protein